RRRSRRCASPCLSSSPFPPRNDESPRGTRGLWSIRLPTLYPKPPSPPTAVRRPRSSRGLGRPALSVPAAEWLAILPPVNAGQAGRPAGGLHPTAQCKPPELFELFDVLQRRGGLGGQLEKKIPAVRVQPQVVQEPRRLGGEVGLAVANVRDRRSAEVERPAV